MDETFSVDISPACSRRAVSQCSFIVAPQAGGSLSESINRSFNYTFKSADSFKEICIETHC